MSTRFVRVSCWCPRAERPNAWEVAMRENRLRKLWAARDEPELLVITARIRESAKARGIGWHPLPDPDLWTQND